MQIVSPRRKRKNPVNTTPYTTLSNVSQQKKKKWLTVGQKDQPIMIMILISLFLFGGIASRLTYFQIIKGQEFAEKAASNRTKIIPQAPVRGNLFDRKGRVLASTRLSHSAYLLPRIQIQPNWEEVKIELAQILNTTPEELEKKIQGENLDSPTLVKIGSNLTPQQITAIEENREVLGDVELNIETIRNYPNNRIASHVLGYTREINAEQLERLRSEGYRLGDVIGQMGVERGLEAKLRGEWGGIILETDGAGKIVRRAGVKEAVAGDDIQLTLDLELQKVAQEALGDRKGAVVALDPRDGAVLAMVSYPGFDPNIFSDNITPEIWQEVQGKGNPFINRSIVGFPPASTFKVVTAAAGMETGKYPPNTVLPTYAFLRRGGMALGEWNRAGFGPMNYIRSMAWSSNTFYGQIGYGIGGENLIEWSRKFGFGSKTGIELLEENPGLIADNEWKKSRFDMEWTGGDTINMSIGQGFTLATPLQVAGMFAIIANGGYRIVPHLENDPDTYLNQKTSLNMQPETLSTIKQGLRSVVTSGTGGGAAVPNIAVAGKSGTAEAPPGKSHAWFGAYAPYDDPSIVVVAFVEHSGGGGGSVAAPIVQRVLNSYFTDESN
ncbi:penicillin-binding protein 2 [Cyanobacterium stanieri LEGE 03274]|uniref:Penicillin-binding protein 2 n=1 Tax=Cyanobacterium stanieri LEGE 03274 TaxID=1828756 RepID=A0ABR9V5E1_9CHRO|nr:penicillin-binding protein 2 [Cyanobacterium stanieri]MBE9223106.1 penicillin-binding protein 2 [Cyanobacterium stanieri LEGE 03274]